MHRWPTSPFPFCSSPASRLGDAVAASGLVKRAVRRGPRTRASPSWRAPRRRRCSPRRPGWSADRHGRRRRSAGTGAPVADSVRGRRWGLVLDLRGSGVARLPAAAAARRLARAAHAPTHKVVEAARLLQLEERSARAIPVHRTRDRGAGRRRSPPARGPILAVAPGCELGRQDVAGGTFRPGRRAGCWRPEGRWPADG